MNKIQHERWLKKRGLSRKEVIKKTLSLGSPYLLPEQQYTRVGNSIPANGTKSPDTTKANFTKQNYILAPAYNKGAIQPISKNDIKEMGKKL